MPALSQWRGASVAGYSLRVDGYRYTEWVNQTDDLSAPGPDWAARVAAELYLHPEDTGAGEGLEDVNVAGQAPYAAVEAKLSALLHAARPTPAPTPGGPPDACPGFAVAAGTNYKNGTKLSSSDGSTAAECCALCTASAACQVWVFVDTEGSKAEGKCTLYGADRGAAEKAADAVAGVRSQGL
jgi:hypothetical protein